MATFTNSTKNTGTVTSTAESDIVALKLNGTSAFGQWTNGTPSVPTTSATITLLAWFKLGADAIDNANSQPVLSYVFWRMHIRRSTNQLQMRTDDGTARIAQAPTGLGAGDRGWHLAVGTYTPTGGTNYTLKCYVDGVLKQTTNVASGLLPQTNYDTTGGLISKTTTGISSFFTGKIKDVRIYHSELGATEIAQIYAEGVDGYYYETTPNIWFKLNDGTGSTVTDVVNSNSMSLTSPTWEGPGWSNSSEHSASLSAQNMNSSSWTGPTLNTSSFSNQTKN